jgi:hypothetical protein
MKNGEVITIYLPIFEEKFAKLEARDLGDTIEAARLHRVTQWPGPSRLRPKPVSQPSSTVTRRISRA